MEDRQAMRIGTRTRKIWSDITARKVRTLLVASSIFIGVFGVVTLISTGEILIGQLEKDIQQDRLAMVRMQVSTVAGAEVDNAAVLDVLSREPGVTEVEGRAVYPLYWREPGDTVFTEGTIVAHVPGFDEGTLEPVRLVEGDYPGTGQQQIAIERRMADRYGLAIGDTLELRILSAAGTNGAGDEIVVEPYTIAGIFFQPYPEIGGTGPIDADALVFATYDEARHIAGFAGLSAIYARFVDFPTADAAAGRFQTAVGQRTPYVPAFTEVEDPAESGLIENTRSTNRILVILAMVALVVSGFLVINVINATVGEQRRQIGVMKAMGATRWDTLVIYSGIALMYGVIGVIPGVLLGIPGGYFAARGLAAQSNTIIDSFTVSPTGIMLGVIVGLAVPLLASILPVLAGTRVTILEAMTDLGIKASYGRDPIARLIARLPMPITLRQALNNVNQKKFRLALTGTTLTVAVGAFMGIFAVFSSLGDVIEDVFASLGTAASIQPNEGQRFETIRPLLTSEAFQARLAAEGLPQLASLTPGSSLSIEIEGYNPPPISAGPPGIFALGYDTSTPELAQLTFTAGSGWDEDPTRDGVVISARIAESMGKQPGDAIVIRAGSGSGEYTILGIASYPFDTVWMKWDDLSRLGGLVVEGEPYPNTIDLRLAVDDPTVQQVDGVIKLITETLLANGITSSATNWVEFKETITGFVTVFNVILNLASALIAAVGAIGLLTSLSMSVFERQKEIGVMRSVGAGSGAIALQFLIEGLIIGMVAWAFGVPVSYFLGQGLIAALPFEDFGVGFPLFTLIVGLVGMLIITTLASLWPSLSAARRTVSDILRYQ